MPEEENNPNIIKPDIQQVSSDESQEQDTSNSGVSETTELETPSVETDSSQEMDTPSDSAADAIDIDASALTLDSSASTEAVQDTTETPDLSESTEIASAPVLATPPEADDSDQSTNGTLSTPPLDTTPTDAVSDTDKAIESAIATAIPSGGDQASHSTTPIIATSGGSKKRSFGKLLAIVVAVLLIIGGSALAYVLLTQKEDNTSPNATKTKQEIELLRVGFIGETINVNYPEVTLDSAGAVEASSQIFEGLVQYDDINKIKPMLATSWTNPDNSTWVFTLKKDVKFHTGRTMTAEDVKASIDAAKQKGDTSTDSNNLYTETIASVEVVGTDKVQIKTKSPDPILLNRLPYVYIYDAASDTPNSPLNGTGPYTLKEDSTPSESKIELVAFTDYHGDKVYTKELHFIDYAGAPEALAAFKAGELDISPDLPNSDIASLKTENLYTEKGGVTGFIGFSQRANGLSTNKAFREAMQYVIDKTLYIEKEELTAQPAHQLIPQEITGHVPTIKPAPQDIEKVKQLLKEANIPEGSTITLAHSDDYIAIPELQKQFAAAGITLQPRPATTIDEIIEQASSGSVDMFLVSYASSLVDGLEFLTQPIQDIAGYDDPKYNETIDKINSEFDAAKRLELLQQAAQIVADEYLIIPIYEREYVYPLAKPYIAEQDVSGSIRGIFYHKVYIEE